MDKYNPKEIEPKWQKYWEKTKIYQPDLDKAKKPYYNLMMFPYPSAEGLHVGNMYAFVHSDAYGRFMRLQGFDVFEPIGLDGFGIHSENYAIKIKEHIKDVSERTEKHFYQQLHMIGNGYDWRRTVETYKPNYYKWTQWLFLKMYEKGLAVRKKSWVNWCPSCKTVLSDEQIINNRCERCGNETRKKEMKQWFWKITEYAEELLKNLDWIDWSEEVKTAQRNWIGRSEGAIIRFSIISQKNSPHSQLPLPPAGEGGRRPGEGFLEVFTTRLDTIYGCTYCVVAPEHPIISDLKDNIKNWEEVEKYIEESKEKTEIDRTAEKNKTGVEIKGVKVINPFNGEAIPLYVADYILLGYGTGAVMAVPAHDQRDFEFAKDYKLPIRQSIAPLFIGKGKDKIRENKPDTKRKVVDVIVKHWSEDKYFCLDWKFNNWKSFIVGGVEEGETLEKAAVREAKEESGYKNMKVVRQIGGEMRSRFFAAHKDINQKDLSRNCVFVQLIDGEYEKPEAKHTKNHNGLWVEKNNVAGFLSIPELKIYWDMFLNGEKTFVDDGIAVNSKEYSGLSSKEAREKMAKWLSKNDLGGKKINYKLRDWCISRQRYWGPPIPMINCPKCGWVPVPEKDLPVILPEMDDFLPDGSGKGPLNKVKSFVETTCPKCQSPAERETDVSDPFVDSSWYYMRYLSTDFSDKALDKKRLSKWMPVDMYIGGKEHSVLHLLYSRFVTMVMHELGYAPEEEPFEKFRAHGLLIKDGAKMSKSKGNIVNPDEYIARFSADAMRLYLMFLGDMRQGGDWRDSGIAGMHRFTTRVWKAQDKIVNSDRLGNLAHKIVKGVKEDINSLKYNTAISKLMILVNKIYETGCSRKEWEKFLVMLSIFAPHIAEELWNKLGHTESIFKEKWPEYNPKLARDEEIELVVQINGKVRDKIKASANISEEEAKKAALNSEKIKKYIEGKKIKKAIFVKGRLINFVAS